MFFSALAFSQHLTFIFTFAGIVSFILCSKPELFKNPLLVLKCLLIFTFTFWSLELYLLIRANVNPVINWGNPSTPGSLLFHVTGRQFAGFAGDTKPSISYVAKLIWQNFNVITVFVAGGLLYAFKISKKLFILTIVSSLFIFFFLSAYIVEGSEVNFVPFIPFGIMLATLGFRALPDYIATHSRKLKYGVCFLFIAAAFLQAYLYFNDNNLSGDYQVKDYMYNVMHYLDKNAVVITQGDGDQYLEKYGYKYIIYPMMLGLEWYREKTIRQLPELDFLREIKRIKDVTKETIISETWKIINTVRKGHTVIIINDKKTAMFTKNAPEQLATTGLFYYLMDQGPHDLPIKLSYRFSTLKRFQLASLNCVYGAVHVMNSSYYVKIGELDEAREEIEKAWALNPDVQIRDYASKVYVWLGNREFMKGNFSAALDYYRKALSFTPNNEGILKNIGYAERKMGSGLDF
jgi:tetratricopeptide (TPR) repeat protein